MSIWLKILLALICIVPVAIATIYYVLFRPVINFDVVHPPAIIQAHFMPLERVDYISKFRSGAGHDFSDATSPCSSMKHYFQPPFDPNQYNNNGLPPKPNGIDDIPIVSPVEGRVSSISEENTPIGKQITIQTTTPGIQIRLFHIFPIDGLKRGSKLKAGDPVGVIGASQGTDIAVQVNVRAQQRFLSYFEVMPESLFADYASYGITSRDQLIISQADRNTHPLQCEGETFLNQKPGFENNEDYVQLQTLAPSKTEQLPAEPTKAEIKPIVIPAQQQPTTTPTSQPTVSTPPASTTSISDGPPLLIKGLGINLDAYDPTTGMAGDLKFTKDKLQFDVLFTQFGYVIPGNQTSTGQNKTNPQPTWQAPLGTPVRSIVDGVVMEIPKLYSNDYSVMVGSGNNSPYRYETEHVINVRVKVGDQVKAGDIIAEVSPHNKEGNSGLGLVEIGLLKGGNPPQHLCPFSYLDPSIKSALEGKLRAFYQSWNEYKGQTLYHPDKESPLGCLTTQPIDG